MKRTTIYFNESKLNKLKEFSHKNKISVSDTIRLAIDNLLEEKGVEDKINYQLTQIQPHNICSQYSVLR